MGRPTSTLDASDEADAGTWAARNRSCGPASMGAASSLKPQGLGGSFQPSEFAFGSVSIAFPCRGQPKGSAGRQFANSSYI